MKKFLLMLLVAIGVTHCPLDDVIIARAELIDGRSASVIVTQDCAGDYVTGILNGTFSCSPITNTNGNPFCVDADTHNQCIEATNNGTAGDATDDGFIIKSGGGTTDGLYTAFLRIVSSGTIGQFWEMTGGDATDGSEPPWFAFRRSGTAPFQWALLFTDEQNRIRVNRDTDGTLTTPSNTTGMIVPAEFIHATDCTAVTTGLEGDVCYEKDADTWYVCEPTSGGCDTAAEWRLTGSTSTNALLDAVNHSDTTNSAVTRGDLIIGNSTPAWDDLAIGGANTYLKSNGTDPSWAAFPARFFMGCVDDDTLDDTGYFSLNAANTCLTADNTTQITWFNINVSGTVRDLCCQAATAPGASQSFTYKVREDGVDTALTVVISGTAVTACSTTESDAVDQNDRLSISHTATAGSADGGKMNCMFSLIP